MSVLGVVRFRSRDFNELGVLEDCGTWGVGKVLSEGVVDLSSWEDEKVQTVQFRIVPKTI